MSSVYCDAYIAQEEIHINNTKNMNTEEALDYWKTQSALYRTIDNCYYNDNSSFGMGLLGAGLLMGLFNGD